MLLCKRGPSDLYTYESWLRKTEYIQVQKHYRATVKDSQDLPSEEYIH